MSETLWARCIRRRASDSDWGAERGGRQKDGLCEDNEKAMCLWVAPDPRVRDVKFHNAEITLQNLNKADFNPAVLHLLWKTVHVWTSGMCLWRAVHLTKPLPDI